jgi:hypothetical protein
MSTIRTLCLLVVTLSITGLLVPAGAAPIDSPSADHATSGIVLSPADSPNGRYATVTDSGDLALSIDGSNSGIDAAGANAEALTTIDRVFAIRNAADRPATVWVDEDAESVRFYRGASSDEPMESREDAVTLAPNQTVHVGLLIDTRGDHDVEDADSFTVHAERPEPSSPGDDPDEDHEPPVETPTSEPTASPTATPESTPEPTPSATPGSTLSTDGPIVALGEDGGGGEGGDGPSPSDSGSDGGSDASDVSESSILGLTSGFGGFTPDPGSVTVTLAGALLGLGALFRLW